MIELCDNLNFCSKYIRDYKGIVLKILDKEFVIFFDLEYIHYAVIDDEIRMYSLSDEVVTFSDFFAEEFSGYPLETLSIVRYIVSTEDYKIKVY